MSWLLENYDDGRLEIIRDNAKKGGNEEKFKEVDDILRARAEKLYLKEKKEG